MDNITPEQPEPVFDCEPGQPETVFDCEPGQPETVFDCETGRLRICEDKCNDCVFRPGNLMHLEPGRVKGMVEEAISAGGHIVCHQTLSYGNSDLDLPGAVCAGFADHPAGSDASLALRVARSLGRVTWVNTDTGELSNTDTYGAQAPARHQ